MTGDCTAGFSLLETHVCSSGNPPSVPIDTELQPALEREPPDSAQKRKWSTPVEEGHSDKRQRTDEANNVGVEDKNIDGVSLLR